MCNDFNLTKLFFINKNKNFEANEKIQQKNFSDEYSPFLTSQFGLMVYYVNLSLIMCIDMILCKFS